MVDALLVAAQACFAQLRIGEREDLERPAALAQEHGGYPVLLQLEGARERETESSLGPLDRRVEIADEKSGVVKCSEQRP